MAKTLSEQVRRGNDWYLADQMVCSKSSSQRRVITNRIKFVVETLTEWKAKTCEERNSVLPLELLDAGCGDGVNLKFLGKLEDFKIYGVDHNPIRVERAKKNCPEAIIKQGSLLELDFDNGFFDVILCNHVIEHIEDDLKALNELYRVLKPEGILILGAPNEGCFIARLRNNIIQPRISKTTDHIHFYTKNELLKKIKSVGFKVLRIRREGFFMPHLRMNNFLASTRLGFSLLTLLGSVWKSQCGGFHFVCEKDM